MTKAFVFSLTALAFGSAIVQGAVSSNAEAVTGSTDIYDYMVMNVCVGSDGSPTKGNPLECSQQRDVRPGDRIPYVHADFPASPKDTGCKALGMSRRYAFPLQAQGSDEAGQTYPLIAAWTDYPPAGAPCDFGTFDARDTATLLAVGPKSASLVGAHHHGGWFLTIGAGYQDSRKAGVSRFMNTWSFPRTVPAMGETGWGVFKRRTERFAASSISRQAFPASNAASSLTSTVQFWKRIQFRYGLKGSETRPVDTLLHIPFTKVSETGDAPGESRGSEHFYLTKELGYVTRWESWARDDANKDVMALARKAYSSPACSMPATIAGQVTPHFKVGAVVDDSAAGVYRQQITTTNRAGQKTTHEWFMTGCHDFTNVSAVAPYDPFAKLTEDDFGPDFIRQFQSDAGNRRNGRVPARK